MDCCVVHPYQSGRFGGSDQEALRPGGSALTRQAIQHAGFVAGEHILDLGCGEGAGTQWLLEQGCHAIGLDASADSLASTAARLPGVSLITASACSLPFANASLDGILAECLLSLVEQRGAVLTECHRVLRCGGRLAITDVFAREAVGAGQQLPACLTGMAPQNQILAEVAQAGFRVQRWEDHSQALKTFMARLIFESGTSDGLWAGDAGVLNAALRQCRPGYFLLIAIKD